MLTVVLVALLQAKVAMMQRPSVGVDPGSLPQISAPQTGGASRLQQCDTHCTAVDGKPVYTKTCHDLIPAPAAAGGGPRLRADRGAPATAVLARSRRARRRGPPARHVDGTGDDHAAAGRRRPAGGGPRTGEPAAGSGLRGARTDGARPREVAELLDTRWPLLHLRARRTDRLQLLLRRPFGAVRVKAPAAAALLLGGCASAPVTTGTSAA